MGQFDKWDYRFMELARMVASWGKNPTTQVGAVIIRNRRVLGMGYNGFPSKIEDRPERLNVREVKHSYEIHAEMNALTNAEFHVEGGTLYVYGLSPCTECAKLIIQSGIKRVVYYELRENKLWNQSMEHAKAMFEEAAIPTSQINIAEN